MAPKMAFSERTYPRKPPANTSSFPASWMTPVRGEATRPSRRDTSHKTHHFEHAHHGTWTMDMKKEVSLGLAPAEWSVSSAMNDPRPNGKAFFDARFINNPIPRHNAGLKMTWDAVGLANAKAEDKVQHVSVDPADKYWGYGGIKGLTSEQLQSLRTMDAFDVDVRSAKAEERMSQVDAADGAGGAGTHKRAGFGGVSYWT